MTMNSPVVIEVAVNGGADKNRNPNSPQSPEEVAEVAAACIAAGASVIHTHIEDMYLPGKEAAERYRQAWQPLRKAFPDVILYPTIIFDDAPEVRFGHLPYLADGAADMGALDPGSINLAISTDGGLPSRELIYINSYRTIRFAFEQMEKLQLGPSLAIYDPTFLRSVIAWQRLGKLPRGAFVKLYFGGDRDFIRRSRRHQLRPAADG